MPLITLTTDFGTKDAYVAAMKGVLLTLAPHARLIDFSHEIDPQDIMEAAFLLQNATPFYPPNTVHVAVVDPGVGTERLPIAIRHQGQYFVGPDNGLFSLMLDNLSPEEAVVLDKPEYWRTKQPSHTFHGRDIFSSIAAHLHNGVPLQVLGTSLDQIKPLYWALPIADEQGIHGWIKHIDRFGNCVSNIHEDLLQQYMGERSIKCYVGNTILANLHTTYAKVAIGESLSLVGSHGYLEVAINGGNAASLLGIRKGNPISIVFTEIKSGSLIEL